MTSPQALALLHAALDSVDAARGLLESLREVTPPSRAREVGVTMELARALRDRLLTLLVAERGR
jgi:hypothetical protein